MPARLFSHAESERELMQLLPEDVRMLRRLDDENFMQDSELTPKEKKILHKLAGLQLVQSSSPGQDQQWIPSSNIKRILREWSSIGKQDEDAQPVDPFIKSPA